MDHTHDVNLYLNTWIINNPQEHEVLDESGFHNWMSEDFQFRTFFRVFSCGELKVTFNIKAPTGPSTLCVKVNETENEVVIYNMDYEEVNVGSFNLDNLGYYSIDVKVKDKTSPFVADLTAIKLSGSATEKGVLFFKNKNESYYGRRGPSVHLFYEYKTTKDIAMFYNEICVPKDNDIIGSYYMANGFDHGYFGIQVNSETERRILFSIWSPFKTDNPEDIPPEKQIKLLAKGDQVHSREFGGEGSGGQSYRIFNWKSETTYKFLLKASLTEEEDNCTDYTAYIFLPEYDRWSLIASFRRPKTRSYLKGLYSFLENFRIESSCYQRKCYFKNQWICDTEGNWSEITKCSLTADDTAKKKVRFDFDGGSDEKAFYLSNCGFFNGDMKIGNKCKRVPTGAPEIKLEENFDKY